MTDVVSSTFQFKLVMVARLPLPATCFGTKCLDRLFVKKNIERIVCFIISDKLRVCFELGFDATSCLGHDIALRNVRKWFGETSHFSRYCILPDKLVSFLKKSVFAPLAEYYNIILV